ncbi:MAG: FHA domain-containing protein [Planctomycetes bacterium]|nr:FHA domain-containing protein [Planctomycetota bacterium]
MKRIDDYLQRLSARGEAEFMRGLPDLLLVEIEGTEGGKDNDPVVTAQLNTNALRSQSLATREARVFPLGGDDGVALPTTVGRAAPSGVLVEHSSVSKQHARLERGGEGGLVVEDLGSTNGTFVNGQKVPVGVKHPVRPDDVVRFGRASMYHLLDPSGFRAYLDLLQRFGL